MYVLFYKFRDHSSLSEVNLWSLVSGPKLDPVHVFSFVLKGLCEVARADRVQLVLWTTAVFQQIGFTGTWRLSSTEAFQNCGIPVTLFDIGQVIRTQLHFASLSSLD